jgi:hypothetical protein
MQILRFSRKGVEGTDLMLAKFNSNTKYFSF